MKKAAFMDAVRIARATGKPVNEIWEIVHNVHYVYLSELTQFVLACLKPIPGGLVHPPDQSAKK